MLVADAPLASLLEEIRTREVDFDLSEEMLDEMRRAGVPPEVIRAMVERQREQDDAEQEPTNLPSLRVSLNPALRDIAGEPTPALYFPTRLGDNAACAALQLDRSDESRTVTDLAVFIACRSPEHVPDYWRSKSPLGRDFVSMPRHRILTFHPGAVEITRKELPRRFKRKLVQLGPPSGSKMDFLQLEVPDTLEAEAAGDQAHHLVVGVAIRVGGRFLRVVSLEKEGVVFGSDSRLSVRVVNTSGNDAFGLEVGLSAEAP